MIQSTIYLVEDGQDCIACNKRNEAKQIARQWCEAYMMGYDENERKKMQIYYEDIFNAFGVRLNRQTIYFVRIRTVDCLEV